MLNSKQCYRLYAVLVTIDPTLAELLLDAYSAIRGVINEQQTKGKAKKVIKEFNEANPTFPVSEADFIFFDQEKKKKIANARAKELALPLPKKNNNYDNMDYQGDMDEADEIIGHIQDFDTLIPVIKATKNVNQKIKGKLCSNYVNIGSISDQDNMISHAQNSGLVTRNNYDIESTDITNSENDDNMQDSDTLVSATNALLLLKSSRSSYSIKKPNINQNTLTPIMSLLKKSLQFSAQRQNGIEDTFKQNDTIKNNTQGIEDTLKQNKQNGIVKNNTQYAGISNNTNKINTRTKNLQYFQNHNGIENVFKQNSIVKNNTQGSGTSDSIGKKRKGEQKAKEIKARVNKKTKTNKN
ncbi:33878_t:CDS:10 [Gigaspora margarita]|uniref:33878_t:CDS:1 n=1 Tax=Gigaspora margarita TaxID=4874 RepID=A0ABN7V6G9_GIGMA|nr:33878_t:CDS:10 [Gigaspora margarita]